MQADKKTLQLIEELNTRFDKKNPEDVLGFFLLECKRKIALSSSLGAEDQVLTEMISKIDPETKIFTLDTGRLFPETYDLISETNKKYHIKIEVFFPDYKSVETMVKEKGINLFYESIENRKLCCHLRKIEPAKRAFKGLDVWISGLRKDQSLNRFNTKLVEWDEVNGLIKVNPLLNWSEKDVWNYIKEKDVPYNALHDKGFPSIGCQPCTRAVKKDEDIRAGRWWWEEAEHNECGLHVK
ncbi:MAG: phosphoadenylyl-sulfate reductase [Bacteroidales bacterium]|nr:phosphoadenylyl-sulfate reductase [Bacteroidales bacterium]MCF8406120.1 phosphoadenylyl-sulfate reductase [Bacteroidales bacterium]